MFSKFLERTNLAAAVLPVITVGTATVNGIAIDRNGYISAGLAYIAGINPSVPTGFTVALKIQHSALSGSGYVDFITSIPTFGTAADLSAASVAKYFDIDLTGAKQFVRVVATLTFTGGASPSAIWAAELVLGDKNVEPAGNSVVYLAD